MAISHLNENICHDLKLEIVFSNSGSNEQQLTNNSAAQGLKII